jgi:hypothetical protein
MPRPKLSPVSSLLFYVLCFVFYVSALPACGTMSKGDRPALFTLPPAKRVLVFIDVRPNVPVPPDFPADLGQKISDHLYQHHATEHVVSQSRLTELRRDPEKFSAMGIADIAQATDADIVLHVDTLMFSVSALSDESITMGLTQALVKVVDKNGKRLWPTLAATGAGVEARIDPAFAEQRDRPAVQKEMSDLLAIRIGRMFHKYAVNDSQMNK